VLHICSIFKRQIRYIDIHKSLGAYNVFMLMNEYKSYKINANVFSSPCSSLKLFIIFHVGNKNTIVSCTAAIHIFLMLFFFASHILILIDVCIV